MKLKYKPELEYFEAAAEAILSAKSDIFIEDWWLVRFYSVFRDSRCFWANACFFDNPESRIGEYLCVRLGSQQGVVIEKLE